MIIENSDGEAVYSLIVGAGQMDREVRFALSQTDAAVLSEQHERHAAFRNILYFSLQRKLFGPDRVHDQAKLQALFDELTRQVLRSSETEFARVIEEQALVLNSELRTFINRDTSKLKSGSKYTEWGI
jgi:EAL domain-containing protein (putative c-di-GMP-specific phosphodiesterase class I)